MCVNKTYIGLWENYFILKLLTTQNEIKQYLSLKRDVCGINIETDKDNQTIESIFSGFKKNSPKKEIYALDLKKEPIIITKNILLYILTLLNSEEYIAELFGKNKRQIQYLRRKFEEGNYDITALIPLKKSNSIFKKFEEEDLKILINNNYFRNQAACYFYSKIEERINEKKLLYLIQYFLYYPLKIPSRKRYAEIKNIEKNLFPIIRIIRIKKEKISYKIKRTIKKALLQEKIILTEEQYDRAIKHRALKNNSDNLVEELINKIKDIQDIQFNRFKIK